MRTFRFRSRLYRKSDPERQDGPTTKFFAPAASDAIAASETTLTMKGARGQKERLWQCLAILLAIAFMLFPMGSAQIAKRKPADKGPRALGLLELASNGKAHLLPVAIMIDGRFYDAGAYKADPVPMALQSDIVYEAVKTGVSQGIFTTAGAFHNSTEGWVADGKWRTQAQIDADKAKAKAEAEKRNQKAPADQDLGGPPKLKRGAEGSPQSSKSQPPSSTPASSSPTNPPSTGTTASSSDSGPKLTKRAPEQQAAASSIDDANRPTLRHQAPSEATHEQTKAGGEAEPLKGPLEFIPAISDPDGPDPRPYSYQMKPDEEEALMKKMQAMAADEVRARAAHLTQQSTTTKTPSAKKPKAAPAPEFHDPQLRVFDLSNSNEPVLVLTAQAKLPANDLDFMVALVARQDIYGDLHKVFAQTTDDKHLDAVPRYDLIDAVDANGDGVGELLFKESWDSGTAYAIYSVIGDQLWPLFEGKPGT